eukprot:335203-Prorocentrum_minimum.AAC.2
MFQAPLYFTYSQGGAAQDCGEGRGGHGVPQERHPQAAADGRARGAAARHRHDSQVLPGGGAAVRTTRPSHTS